MRLLVHEISSENYSVNGIFTVSTRWISHNFFRIWIESPTLSELISVSSGRIDFKIVLNQSYGCILPGKNCFGTVPSPQDVDKKFAKKSWTLFPKSPTTSLQRESYECRCSTTKYRDDHYRISHQIVGAYAKTTELMIIL